MTEHKPNAAAAAPAGAMLAAWIKDRGHTQTSFGELIGCSGASVSRYCAGRIPDADVIVKIHHATDGAIRPDHWYLPAGPVMASADDAPGGEAGSYRLDPEALVAEGGQSASGPAYRADPDALFEGGE